MTIYFYKVWQPYGCFSNFSPHSILIKGTYWPTVEHYYQAQKFVNSPDANIIPLIHAATTPEDAAALGRCHTRKLRLDWDMVKTQVMRIAVRQKFITHGEIRQILLGTGEEILVENSPTDYFWGCGADHTGENNLGKILMSVRSEIRSLFSTSEKSEKTLKTPSLILEE
ncbi:NADAR family protein [Anabaena sp. FACHB-1237]|uniref:NADAR family protein n=1 Tax=Anabaena sp. FACHB-1237 TaxID=2692769 RepID=UPI00168021A4|nr:NADAR domain-containing protein [Anabaena sp. FACHB-1237]MBD2136623.1 NADAR family protein [Anabaena sp. FACHB-1237]